MDVPQTTRPARIRRFYEAVRNLSKDGCWAEDIDGLTVLRGTASIRPWHASFSAAWRSFKALACARLRLSRPFMRWLLLAQFQDPNRSRLDRP